MEVFQPEALSRKPSIVNKIHKFIKKLRSVDIRALTEMMERCGARIFGFWRGFGEGARQFWATTGRQGTKPHASSFMETL
jgi:hypothetical protein